MARQHGATCHGCGMGMSKRAIIYFLNDFQVRPRRRQSRRHSHSHEDEAESKGLVYSNLRAVAAPGVGVMTEEGRCRGREKTYKASFSPTTHSASALSKPPSKKQKTNSSRFNKQPPFIELESSR